MVLVVFRSRLCADLPDDAAEFRALADRMLELASAMPGFVSYKVFVAADDERCSVIEFETADRLRAWQQHPEHQAAMKLGRERFYETYSLRVGEPERQSDFVR